MRRNGKVESCGRQQMDRLAYKGGRRSRPEGKESEYLGTFVFVPDLWAGMHMGRVVSVEIGASKQGIVYMGDTMNTTARIKQACRTYQKPFLLSGALLASLKLPEGWSAEGGRVELRGVSEKVELFALTDGADRKGVGRGS